MSLKSLIREQVKSVFLRTKHYAETVTLKRLTGAELTLDAVVIPSEDVGLGEEATWRQRRIEVHLPAEDVGELHHGEKVLRSGDECGDEYQWTGQADIDGNILVGVFVRDELLRVGTESVSER